MQSHRGTLLSKERHRTERNFNVKTFKYALFATGTLNNTGLLFSLCFIIVMLFIGLFIFSKVERTFMDIV